MGAGNAPETTGVFIVNHKEFVLDAVTASPGSYVTIQPKQSDNNETQLWKLRQDGVIEHVHTGLVLSISNETAGTKLTLTHEDGSDGQYWRYDTESGAIQMERKRELVIDVEGANALVGSFAIAWYRLQPSQAFSQKWLFQSIDSAPSDIPPPLFPTTAPSLPLYASVPPPSLSSQVPPPSEVSSEVLSTEVPLSSEVPPLSEIPPPPSDIPPYSEIPSPSLPPSIVLPPPLSAPDPLFASFILTPGDPTPTGEFSPISAPLPPPPISDTSFVSPSPSVPPHVPDSAEDLSKQMDSLSVSSFEHVAPYAPDFPSSSPFSVPSPSSIPESPSPVSPSQYAPPSPSSPLDSPAPYTPPPQTYSSPFPNVAYSQPIYPQPYQSTTLPLTHSSPAPYVAYTPAYGTYSSVSASVLPQTYAVTSPYVPTVSYSSVLPLPSSPFPPGPFFIVSRINGYVLDVDRGNGSPLGAQLLMWPRKQANYANQLWRFDSDGFLRSEESGLVMEVDGEKNARPGRRIRMAHRKPMDHELVANQRWRYDSVNETFVNYKGLRLDVDRSRTAPGTPLLAWSPITPIPNNQRFYIVRL